MVQITQTLLFSGMPLLERSKITVWKRHLFHKKICYVSTLCKKVFSGAPVKCAFLYESNNLNSVVFENDGFAEIKDHSLRTTTFKTKLSMEVLGLCLPYVKRYFQEHQSKVQSCKSKKHRQMIAYVFQKNHKNFTFQFLILLQ